MAKLPPLLSELQFGAFLVYSPRGVSPLSRRSRSITYDIKAFRPKLVERVLENLKAEVDEGVLSGFLGPKVTLIPAPKSAPLVEEGALWSPAGICIAMVDMGFGGEVLPSLERTRAVPKSAFSKIGERPTVKDHLETMRCERSLMVPAKIVVVDDVVTKGATLLAAASHVQEAFPNAEVRGFALVRTKGLEPEITDIVEPCVGKIWADKWGSVHREP